MKCNNCILCNEYLVDGSEYKLKSGFTLKTNARFDCMSRNLNYILTCGGCKENYIGQTGDTLRNRMAVHRQQSKDGCLFIPVKADKHFNTCANGSFTVFPFYKPRHNTNIYREVYEKRWINIVKPKLNALQ